jgi:DNA-binding transcriptional regulator GbsR (MarR family)
MNSKIVDFDEEIEELEQEIVNFLLNKSYFFTGQKSAFVIIKSYFITRKHLTQEMLHNLTGLSRGTISQELNKFLEDGLIRKSHISSTGEITYTLDSVEFAFVHAFYNAQKEIVEFGRELTKLKEEIEKNKESVKDSKGFNQISQIVNLLTLSVPFSLELYKMLEEEFHDLKREK